MNKKYLLRFLLCVYNLFIGFVQPALPRYYGANYYMGTKQSNSIMNGFF